MLQLGLNAKYRPEGSVAVTDDNHDDDVLTLLFTFNYALQPFNTLRTGSFKLFKRLLPGFLTILTL